MDIDFSTTKLSTFIGTSLKEHGWSLLDFCSMLGGIPKAAGSKIANGKQTPSFHQCFAMAKMFSVSVENIIQMRMVEEAAESDNTAVLSDSHQALIAIFQKVPVGEMLSRNWASVADRNDADEMVRVFSPYAAELVNAESKALAHKSNPDDIKFTNLQQAWLLRVRTLARRIQPSGRFTQSSLEKAISHLKTAMNQMRNISDVVSILDQAGIRLVLVECKNSKIDGVCTWLDKASPVIGLTLRFDRIDNFWFNLRHELAHVEQGYTAQSNVDWDVGATISDLETKANKVASQFCTPPELVDEFLSSYKNRVTDDTVREFANKHSLNPSVLAGQIRYTMKKYNILTKLMAKYREELLLAAPVKDGWGFVI